MPHLSFVSFNSSRISPLHLKNPDSLGQFGTSFGHIYLKRVQSEWGIIMNNIIIISWNFNIFPRHQTSIWDMDSRKKHINTSSMIWQDPNLESWRSSCQIGAFFFNPNHSSFKTRVHRCVRCWRLETSTGICLSTCNSFLWTFLPTKAPLTIQQS